MQVSAARLFTVFLIYSPDGANVYGSRGEILRDRVSVGVESCTRKPCYRKDDRAMRPIYGCPEKCRESSQPPPATFPEICKGLLFRSTLRMCIQNLKFVALSVPEIIGVLKKFGQSLYTPTLHFLPKF